MILFSLQIIFTLIIQKQQFNQEELMKYCKAELSRQEVSTHENNRLESGNESVDTSG